MYMTTQQAAETWCPMVRVARIETDETRCEHLIAGCNTDALGGVRVPASCRCIAEKCAMWRWHPTTLCHPGTGALTMNGIGGLTDRIEAKGYCGLAGAPSEGMAAHP